MLLKGSSMSKDLEEACTVWWDQISEIFMCGGEKQILN